MGSSLGLIGFLVFIAGLIFAIYRKRKKLSARPFFIASCCGIVLFFVGVAMPASEPEIVAPKYTASAELQQERLNLFDQCIDKGIFYKLVNHETYPQLWVDSGFYLLDFAQKDIFTNAVWAYYQSNNTGRVVLMIYDRYSGKDIGHYSEVSNVPRLKLD